MTSGTPDAGNITAPTMLYGGWHDIFTNSEPKLYNAIPLPPGKKQLIMGDTYHLNPGSGFGDPGYPPRLDVLLNESRLAPQHLALDPSSPSFVNVPVDVPIP